MARTQVALHAASPRTNECKVQRAADYRTGYRNQTADPLFRGFFAELDGEAFGDTRIKFLHQLLFGQVLAKINSGSSGGGEPKFAALIIALRFESVEQRQALDQAQRNDGEQSRIGDKRNHAAQAEACTFGERQ